MESTDESLGAAETLVYRDLYSVGERGLDASAAPVRQTGVRCGRPLVYPVPVEDLPVALRNRSAGRRYFGALFAFDLDELADTRRYTGARFEVRLADERAIAVQLHGDGGALGLVYGLGALVAASAPAAQAVAATVARPGWLRRLAPRSGQARGWVSGAQSHRFSWSYDDPHGELLMPRSYGMHALLEVPPDATELRGALGINVEISGTGWDAVTRRHASQQEIAAFTEPLPGTARSTSAAVRLCMAADVSGYSGRTNVAAATVQRLLVRVLAQARGVAGIDESAVAPQPQGDGQFTVLPVGIDESTVIPRLIGGLADALRAANRELAPGDRMRLRVALHRGLVQVGDNGWVGNAAIAVHRILDSPPVRAALRDHTATDFVLGVPDVLFHDVIAHSTQRPRPDEFTEITVDLPEKNFIEHGWLYVAPPASE